MSCANNVLPVYMWPSPGKIPEALCLPPVQVDTLHFSSEATETNGFSRLSSSLNRTAVIRSNSSYPEYRISEGVKFGRDRLPLGPALFAVFGLSLIGWAVVLAPLVAILHH